MGRMKAALGLRLDLALRGAALREDALRREVPFFLLADFLPLEAFFFPALRAFLRAAAILALRFEDLFFFLAAFFFLAGFLFLALAIVHSFEFEGFVRLFYFFFFSTLQVKTTSLHHYRGKVTFFEFLVQVKSFNYAKKLCFFVDSSF